MTLGGGNVGALTLSGTLGETGGVQTLGVAANPLLADVRRITLSGANTFTGGVRLDSGHLAIANGSALGARPLVVNGGTLRLSGLTIGNNIVLNRDLVIQSPGGATQSGVIVGAAGAGLTLRNSASSLTLGGTRTLTPAQRRSTTASRQISRRREPGR